jgi:exopolyphosphatase/guanosine-5'-triphosphate,3'-diphosphate pyrophosphatase
MRIASVDIGTNTVTLLVVERDARGSLGVIEERETITRLGEGVGRTGSLVPSAIARTAACIDVYARVVRELGAERVAVVGTSAMRDARGGEALRAHVRSALGVDAQVLSGPEEARLTFLGGVRGLDRDATRAAHVVWDVGGGSTEIVRGTIDARSGSVRSTYAASFDVGSVRLTERHVLSDPPGPTELEAIERDAREAFALIPSFAIASEPIGVAGTMTTIASVARGIVPFDGTKAHGARLTIEEIRRVIAQLARVTNAERRAIPGMAPERADVIVAGAIVAACFLEKIGARACIVSNRGVSFGVAAELARAV